MIIASILPEVPDEGRYTLLVGHRFSKRTAWDLGESGLSAAIKAARANGRRLIDLTVSNPTICGFEYDAEQILAPLGDRRALTYDPDPRGMSAARTAVAKYYRERQAQVDAGRVVLTTSTSEAYSFLFRLLCDAGDEVLVPQPSYPLFDFLATLDDVCLTPYPLFYDFGWWIDFVDLERRIGARTRAILVVHPNNPTGHATSVEERRQLELLCRKHGLALIVDEVFLDYGLQGPIASFATKEHPCLTFVLSGISKIAGLPQMKVGWLVAIGEEAQSAMARLEVIADTFLSMNAPAQLALEKWLEGSGSIGDQIVRRVQTNVKILGQARAVRCFPVHAGWSAVLWVPQSRGSADLAERLVEEAGVIVHPGSFYGLGGEHGIVVSLIGPTEDFACGVRALESWCKVGSSAKSFRSGAG